MEMMLDKKQIWAIFLFEFKMGHKAVEKTQRINNAVGLGTANKSTGPVADQEILQRKQEPWRWGPLKVDKDQLRASSKLILLQQHKKLPKN